MNIRIVGYFHPFHSDSRYPSECLYNRNHVLLHNYVILIVIPPPPPSISLIRGFTIITSSKRYFSTISISALVFPENFGPMYVFFVDSLKQHYGTYYELNKSLLFADRISHAILRWRWWWWWWWRRWWLMHKRL